MDMTLNEYQTSSERTIPVGTNKGLTEYALGLSGESGEVAEHIKKHVFHGHELNEEEVLFELGDTLHYLTGIASMLGYTLEEVATMNIQKIKERYPKGFNKQDSINRKEKQS